MSDTYKLPEFPARVERGIRKGRSVYDGYQRGVFLNMDREKKVDRDPERMTAMSIAHGRTLIRREKLNNLFLMIKHFLPRIPAGNIIEFGSYKGGGAMFMAALCKTFRPGTRVYGLDTFAGMPETDRAIDMNPTGQFADVDYDAMVAHAHSSGLDNLEFVRGLFEDTAPAVLQRAAPIALAHIDADIRSACAYAYEVVLPCMVPGGYIVFDDATVPGCIGATEVVEDLVIRRDGKNAEQIWPHFVFRHRL